MRFPKTTDFTSKLSKGYSWCRRVIAAAEFEVVIDESPLTVRSPEVMVTSAALARANPARLRGQDVRLATPTTLIHYRLIDGAYENFGEFSGEMVFRLDGSPITLDLDALTTDRAQTL